jgi:hypothetical protein
MLKECSRRTSNSSSIYPCGSENCYKNPNENRCSEKRLKENNYEELLGICVKKISFVLLIWVVCCCIIAITIVVILRIKKKNDFDKSTGKFTFEKNE